jgi:hypothetical protein
MTNQLVVNRCLWACRIAHVTYVGVQSGFGYRTDMLLFQPTHGPLKGSTLSLDIDRVTPLNISAKIAASEDELTPRKAA